MAFISNYQKEGLVIGGKLRLTRNCEVIKGTFTTGSILTVVSLPDPNDYQGNFLCKDESGEEVYLSRVLGGYTKA